MQTGYFSIMFDTPSIDIELRHRIDCKWRGLHFFWTTAYYAEWRVQTFAFMLFSKAIIAQSSSWHNWSFEFARKS
jgi:hypothetical protein